MASAKLLLLRSSSVGLEMELEERAERVRERYEQFKIIYGEAFEQGDSMFLECLFIVQDPLMKQDYPKINQKTLSFICNESLSSTCSSLCFKETLEIPLH